VDEILKTTLLGLFFGTFGTTLRWHNRSYHKKALQQIFKLYSILCLWSYDGSYMF